VNERKGSWSTFRSRSDAVTKLSEAELKRERLRRQKRKSKLKRKKDIAKIKVAKNENLTRKGAVIKTYERKKTLAKTPINKME
jgi:hypothetical protein